MRDADLAEGLVDAFEALRCTTEYQAAYELELWKKREEKNFEKMREKAIKSAVEERLEEMAAKEKKASDELIIRQRAVAKAEERNIREQGELRDKRRILDECEKVLRRKKEEMEREYTRRIRECDDRIRRNREEASHKIGLEKLKLKQLEDLNENLRKKLESSEKSLHELWSAINKKKKEDLAASPSDSIASAVATERERSDMTEAALKQQFLEKCQPLHAKIGRLTSQNASLREQNEKLRTDVQTLLVKETNLKEEAAMMTNEISALKIVCERLRKAPKPTEEPTIIIKESDKKWLPANIVLRIPTLSVDKQNVVQEIARLGKEKDRLLTTTCYTSEDEIIKSLSAQQAILIASL
eukprot:TRINITY_DN2663_c1_g1_i1.p1 TRINITY_DN2663_c1_g1~~TRINITY_DN2663_c1_g1_i1.p1  ORF type:complete len:356 (+),score=107.35 TRINITY_DN2663_c1_g1_i1:1901-2968(+)